MSAEIGCAGVAGGIGDAGLDKSVMAFAALAAFTAVEGQGWMAEG
jgi:hypothetical protein